MGMMIDLPGGARMDTYYSPHIIMTDQLQTDRRGHIGELGLSCIRTDTRRL